LAGEVTGAHKKLKDAAPVSVKANLLTFVGSARGAVDYRRIVFTDADEVDEDNSQVRVITGAVFGWGAR
jgi:hypothetical protein